MRNLLKTKLKSHEFFVLVAIVLLGLLIQMTSGQFFDSNNLVDILRACITPCTFALGTYVVIVSGGIDLSFLGISSIASYLVLVWQINNSAFQENIPLGYFLCFLIGIVLGAVNGFLIGYFKLPPLIVTLGTQNLFWGILFGPLDCITYPLPDSMIRWAQNYMITATNTASNISSSFPTLGIVVFILAALTWLLMSKTMIGRGIYAIGGNVESARRVGYNVLFLQIFTYAFAGGLAGVCGYNRAFMNRVLQVTFESGMEMTIIAGVVLGGVRITGGVGTLSGALLGTIFLTILDNSLLLLGLSAYWADAATGLAIVLGIGITAVQIKLERNKRVRRITAPGDVKEAANRG